MVNTDYVSEAKELIKKLHCAQGGQAGPVEQRLYQYDKAGKVHGTVLGTFGGASQGANDLCDLAADAPAHEQDEDPDEADALLDIHFTNPSAGSGRLNSYM
jgi:hypothetical protein